MIEQVRADLKDAMRARDAVRLGALRMLNAAFIEKEKSGKGPVTDADALAIVQKQARQRRDSIEQFAAAGRTDLVDKEAAELEIIEAYLPAQASDDEIARVVAETISRLEATGPQAMGRVMGEAMGALRGQADGGRVREVVQRLLTAGS